MFEKFTARAREAVVMAQEAAREHNHDYIGSEHLLLGLIADSEDAKVATLRSVDVDQLP